MAHEAPARSKDSHKIPTTGSRPGRQAGEIQPHGTRQDARERDRTRGHPGRRPGDRAGMRITVYPAREEQGPLVWSICRRYRLADADAADAGQAVWLQLAGHIGQIRDPAALPGWLAATTRRECGRIVRLPC